MSNLRSKKLWTSSAVVAALVLLLTVALTHTGRAKPRPAAAPAPPAATGCGPTDEVCREGVLQATYATAINIHNPNATPVYLEKQAVIAYPEGVPPVLPLPSPPATVDLLAGQALEVDCEDIEVTLLGGTTFPTAFAKGFVTIVATQSVDVVGVYSAQPPSVSILVPNSTSTPPATQTQYPGVALEMLQIPQRIVVPPLGSSASPLLYEYSAKFLCGRAAPLAP